MVKFLEPVVSKERALRYFQRFRPGNLWCLLPNRSKGAAHAKQPPVLELIWMPQYLVSFHVESRRGAGRITVTVEGHSGAFAVVAVGEELREGDAPGPVLPPKLTAEEAATIGRQELLRAILRRRGQRDKPILKETLGVELFYYPLWVYYYERRRGLLDIRILDALTSQKGGPKTKTGVLSAFLHADRTKEAPEALHHRGNHGNCAEKMAKN